MSSDPDIFEMTEFERKLMHAAANERVSPELSARMAGALGIPVGPGVAPPAAGTPFGMLLPAGVIMAALGGALGLWALLRPAPEPSAPPAARVVEAPKPRETASPQPPLEVQASAPAAAAAQAPASLANSAPSAPAPAAPSKASSAAAPSSERADLREEIRAIDAVRGALAAHDPAHALSLLGRYRSNFPNGTFGQEATVLRVEALEQSGQHQKAQALSRDFRSKHPNSPLSERLSNASSGN